MKNMLRAIYKDNCFVFVSGNWKTNDEAHDDSNLQPIVSFVYNAGDVAAEWAPGTYGPLTLYHRGTDTPHYVYLFIEDCRLDWSQLAVNEERLPHAFVSGNYDYIFEVLKKWATRES